MTAASCSRTSTWTARPSRAPSTQVAIVGTLTITRANATELAGRLQLASTHDRIDAPFWMTLGPGGESVESDY